MSIRDVRTFKDFASSLKEVNDKIKHWDSLPIKVGTFGRVKVTFKFNQKEVSLTRNELAKYATNLALKMEDPEQARALLETFKRRMGNLDEKIEGELGNREGKRFNAGRKLASFSKHFFDRDKKIEKTIEKLDSKIDELGRSCVQVTAEQMYSARSIATRRGFCGTADHSEPSEEKIAADRARFEQLKVAGLVNGEYSEIEENKCCDLAMIIPEKGFMALVDVTGHAEPAKRALFQPIFDDLGVKVDNDEAGLWADESVDKVAQDNCYVCAKFGQLDGKNGVFTGQCGDTSVFIVDRNNQLVQVPNNEAGNSLSEGERSIVKRFVEIRGTDKGVLCLTDGTTDFLTPDEIGELLIESDFDCERFLELSKAKKEEKSEGVQWVEENADKLADGTKPYDAKRTNYSDDASIAYMEIPKEFRS
ncbi:MAG: hypothetical protein ACK5MA_03805 [Parachlamydiaceae bacterium]